MILSEPPLFSRLKQSNNILIAGAGGGFDVFCGLPLYLFLLAEGRTVHLANLTFSFLRDVNASELHSAITPVRADTEGPKGYFPEKYLAQWLRRQGHEAVIYCFKKTGVRALREAYGALVEELEIDTVLLVDGGTDSLMRGDEAGLGTPAEDMVSVAAVAALDLPYRFLTCLGFGVDSYHGVCHAQFLEAVSELSRADAYLGSFSLHPQMSEVAQYIDAIDYVHRCWPERPSIVNTSIVSALEGQYGDVHRTRRTQGSELWINPLMTQYFSFELEAVAKRVMYLDAIQHTETILEVAAVIEAFRKECVIRPRTAIPV